MGHAPSPGGILAGKYPSRRGWDIIGTLTDAKLCSRRLVDDVDGAPATAGAARLRCCECGASTERNTSTAPDQE
jgi:hypothetical protein